jgi:hypothetical protein
MERLEVIAEAKKNNFNDSEIQLLLEYYDMCIQEGLSTDFDLSREGSLSADEIGYCTPETFASLQQA